MAFIIKALYGKEINAYVDQNTNIIDKTNSENIRNTTNAIFEQLFSGGCCFKDLTKKAIRSTLKDRIKQVNSEKINFLISSMETQLIQRGYGDKNWERLNAEEHNTASKEICEELKEKYPSFTSDEIQYFFKHHNTARRFFEKLGTGKKLSGYETIRKLVKVDLKRSAAHEAAQFTQFQSRITKYATTLKIPEETLYRELYILCFDKKPAAFEDIENALRNVAPELRNAKLRTIAATAQLIDLANSIPEKDGTRMKELLEKAKKYVFQTDKKIDEKLFESCKDDKAMKTQSEEISKLAHIIEMYETTNSELSQRAVELETADSKLSQRTEESNKFYKDIQDKLNTKLGEKLKKTSSNRVGGFLNRNNIQELYIHFVKQFTTIHSITLVDSKDTKTFNACMAMIDEKYQNNSIDSEHIAVALGYKTHEGIPVEILSINSKLDADSNKKIVEYTANPTQEQFNALTKQERLSLTKIFHIAKSHNFTVGVKSINAQSYQTFIEHAIVYALKKFDRISNESKYKIQTIVDSVAAKGTNNLNISKKLFDDLQRNISRTSMIIEDTSFQATHAPMGEESNNVESIKRFLEQLEKISGADENLKYMLEILFTQAFTTEIKGALDLGILEALGIDHINRYDIIKDSAIQIETPNHIEVKVINDETIEFTSTIYVIYQDRQSKDTVVPLDNTKRVVTFKSGLKKENGQWKVIPPTFIRSEADTSSRTENLLGISPPMSEVPDSNSIKHHEQITVGKVGKKTTSSTIDLQALETD